MRKMALSSFVECFHWNYKYFNVAFFCANITVPKRNPDFKLTNSYPISHSTAPTNALLRLILANRADYRNVCYTKNRFPDHYSPENLVRYAIKS